MNKKTLIIIILIAIAVVGVIGYFGFQKFSQERNIRNATESIQEQYPCPKFSPPARGWCDGGEIVEGDINEYGCQGHPKCVK